MSEVRPMLSISIIIPCFNAQRYIKTCLDSILPNLQTHDEVIVIDDASTDKTAKLLRGYRNKKLRIITHDENIGPSRGRNVGADLATEDLLLFLDVDTAITKDTLREIREFFETNDSAGAVQCELRFSDTKLDSIGHFMSMFGFPYEIGVNEHPEAHQTIRHIFGAKSAGIAVRTKIFHEVNGFDDEYLIYGEDTDISWRIQLAGYSMYYLPKSVVYHRQKSSMNDNTKLRVYYEGSKNNLNYILKNASVRTSCYMLPLHIFGWIMISIKLLLQGNYKAASAVYAGLGWNIVHMTQALEKRRKIRRKHAVNLFGDIRITNLLQKGWRWFIHV